MSSGQSGSSTSLSLLEQVRANDPAAWRRLTALYTPLVEHWCREDGVPDSDLPDVCQEVFLAVVRKIGEFYKEDGGTFRGWLRTITWSKVADRLRKPAEIALGGSGPNDPLTAVPARTPADSEVEQSIVYARALALMERDFDPTTWRAFWRVVAEDARPADVAVELGLTVNAVYLAKARVLRRLREEFADLLEPPERGT